MSARRYKEQLDNTLSRLTESAISAREWKKVAENRLALLEGVDHLLDSQIDELLELGTVFGVTADKPALEIASRTQHSAGEISHLITQKAYGVASFIANLAREAVSLQAKLNDVLGIAAEALLTPRPEVDLTLPDNVLTNFGSASPVREVYEEVENDAGPLQNEIPVPGLVVSSPSKKDLDNKYSSALALFGK